MNLVYAPRARQDIADIYDSIAMRNPAAAQRVEDLIRANCEALVHFPYAASATNLANHFRRPLVRFPYTIFYSVDAAHDRIEVLRVIHSARVKDLRQTPED